MSLGGAGRGDTFHLSWVNGSTSHLARTPFSDVMLRLPRPPRGDPGHWAGQREGSPQALGWRWRQRGESTRWPSCQRLQLSLGLVPPARLNLSQFLDCPNFYFLFIEKV